MAQFALEVLVVHVEGMHALQRPAWLARAREDALADLLAQDQQGDRVRIAGVESR